MNLDAQFAFLDDLPESLYASVVTLHHGSLRERVAGILAWRHALLRGELPQLSHLQWPEKLLAEIILKRLDALDLVPLCRNEETLVDQILKDVCSAVASILRRKEQGIHTLFDDIVAGQEKERDRESLLEDDDGSGSDGGGDGGTGESGAGESGAGESGAGANGSAKNAGGAAATNASSAAADSPASMPATGSVSPEAANSDDPAAAPPLADRGDFAENLADLEQATSDISADVLPTTADDAVSEATIAPSTDAASIATTAIADTGIDAEAAAALDNQLSEHWQQLLEQWQETSAVFHGMGSRLGHGWDLSSGELHGSDWRRFVTYRKLIQKHPQLQDIVDSLGRDAAAADDGPVSEISESEKTPGEAPLLTEQYVHSESPLSMSGISRSDDIARMLPQEAAFLGHPKLKMLWHARRSEQGLLSYQVEGVLSEHRPEPLQQILDEDRPRPQREKQRGPLIVCLDSSASMHGKPEDIAKAVTLEVLRLANEDDRRCHLFAFSGPGQVIDLELRFDPPGLRRILRFLAQSFHGGTDIQGPVLQALDKLQDADWEKADMLLITDGRFPVPESVAHAVSEARERHGLKLVGLTVGRWSSAGLKKICQPVYRFQPPSTLAALLDD